METDNPIKQSRSSLPMHNIQEILDAEDSAKWAVQGYAQQYFTPDWLAIEANQFLYNTSPESALDPQCGEGGLLKIGFEINSGFRARRFGIDIDNRLRNSEVNPIIGNCVNVFETLDDVAPGLMFETFSANPPFGKRLKVGDKVVDSTEWTWEQAIKRGCQGVFISNHKTIERLGIDKHPFVTKYFIKEGVWKACDVVIGVVIWHNPDAVPARYWELQDAWDKTREILEEEKKANYNPYNIWLAADGKLKTYLSTRSKVKHKLTQSDIVNLSRVNGTHPLALTTEKETRRLLRLLCDCGFYTIEPEAKAAIEGALVDVNKLACPVMPITDFEAIAYADEEDVLECVSAEGMSFTPGRDYGVSAASYSFTEEFSRNKVHFNDETGETYTEPHTCTLSGQDRYIQVADDYGGCHRFMDKPRKGVPNEHEESLIWKIFRKPRVRTIAEVQKEEVERNKRTLKTCEMLAGYTYYPGQIEYLSRVAVKDSALIAAAVGTGKTLMAISLIAIKAPERALIIAPQGTMRSSEDDDEGMEFQPSQWLSELQRFAPYLQIFQLFSIDDYIRIRNANGGELPSGVYVSYYQAMFQNGARESAPPSWNDNKLNKEYEWNLPKHESGDEDGWCQTLGKEVEGIRCIAEPCMSTLVGHRFDMVLLDESHYCANASASMTQMLIRLQPKYRYALSATPIPNIISNLFYPMGWLCVHDWYKGDRRNAAWPYARGEIGSFNNTFLTLERDHTQERRNRAANPDWRGKCEKASPVISSPAHLLKLLRPTLAFISKEDVNPHYTPAKVVDIRVPMGKEQARLYGHFLDRGNIPCKHPLIRARKQIAYLRAVCADPAGFEHGGPKVRSNLNPKTIAVLELIGQIMQEGEQVTFISARVGQTNTIAQRLTDAGIPFSRIDSTVPPEQHTWQSGRFKRGETRVMLMGIKCAVGHSFPDCPYEIVGSLEYSWGSFDQAKGRVDRVNSTKPRTIYCVLHKTSIEELMFDVLMNKGDASNIVLRGQRVPRQFKPVDASEVLADAITNFKDGEALKESDLEGEWIKLREKIRGGLKVSGIGNNGSSAIQCADL